MRNKKQLKNWFAFGSVFGNGASSKYLSTSNADSSIILLLCKICPVKNKTRKRKLKNYKV
jgi:hypothetical protein